MTLYDSKYATNFGLTPDLCSVVAFNPKKIFKKRLTGGKNDFVKIARVGKRAETDTVSFKVSEYFCFSFRKWFPHKVPDTSLGLFSMCIYINIYKLL